MSGTKKNTKKITKNKKSENSSVYLVSYIDQSSESDGLFPAYLVKTSTKRMAINYVANTDRNSRNFLVAEKMPIIEPDADECWTEEEDNSDHLCPNCREELGSDYESGESNESSESGESNESSESVESNESIESDDLEDLEDLIGETNESEEENKSDDDDE